MARAPLALALAVAVCACTQPRAPADEFDPAWSFEGALQDAQLVFGLLRAVTRGDATPSYKPSSEFAGLRRVEP